MRYGDRAPGSRCAFPPEAFFRPGGGGHVLDVTKPPFGAKGDGVADDTAALCAAMTFVRDHCEIIGKDDQSMCGPKANCNWIIYLPDGVYSVGGAVSQAWPALAMNIRRGWLHVDYLRVASPEEEQTLYRRDGGGRPVLHENPRLPADDNGDGCFIRGQYAGSAVYAEANWNIRIFGESRERTVIRLRDRAVGFGAGETCPVLSFHLLQRGSNVNLGNFLENLTIDTGNGNPGAVALRWNSSNWGGVRNVALRSGDGAGRVALQMACNNATGYCRDLLIEGFETGIELSAGRESMVVLEYATLRNLSRAAIRLGDARSGGGGDSLDGRRLRIEATPLALDCGRAGQGILLESRIQSAVPWTLARDSFLLVRDSVVNGAPLEEFASASPVGGGDGLRLPVREVPVLPSGYDPARWVCVEAFGAAGDGKADDTAAIQYAMDSGKPVIAFARSNYRIDGTVDIPASVEEIVFLFAGIQRAAAGAGAGGFDGPGIFRVAESSERPLLLRQAVTAGGVFLDHETERPVVMEDILVLFNHARSDAAEDDMLFPSAVPQRTSLWRLYRNTRPEGARKELFLTGCVGFAGDDDSGGCAVENVALWGRYLDTEHVPGALYSFRDCDGWIFGFKSENSKTLIRAREHSRLEVLGGTFLNFAEQPGPVLDCEDSQLAACFLLWHRRIAPPLLRRDVDGLRCREWYSGDFAGLEQADAALIFSQ